MNLVVLAGRLTADPEIRYTHDETMVASYTLAVNRIGRDKGADFIRCVAFEKKAQFAEQYLAKGIKIMVTGRMQTGKYEKDGQTHYTTDIVVNNQEFCESKTSNDEAREENTQAPPTGSAPNDGFMNIPDNIDEDLPFN